MKSIKIRWLRVALVGILTVTGCVSYLYFSRNQPTYQMYRCLTGARDWRSCYRTEHFAFTTDLFGLRYQGHTENYIDRHILGLGAYEKHILFFMRDAIRAVSEKPGVFVDVGANTGQHSLFMSPYATAVHAFEPYQPVVQKFRRTVELNHLKNIKIHPVGLGNKNERILFFSPPDTNLGTGSFVEGINEENKKGQQLEIVIGDEALAGVDSVRLIKIDVEGYEKPVLQGLARTLRTNRPVVVFELTISPTESVTFKSKDDLSKTLPDNYRFAIFDTRSSDTYSGFYQLTDMSQVRFDVPYLYDVVAYPAEREGQIPRTTEDAR